MRFPLRVDDHVERARRIAHGKVNHAADDGKIIARVPVSWKPRFAAGP
jgi:hypothetical protein